MRLSRFCLIILSVVFLTGIAFGETIEFAFDQDSPPYSYLDKDKKFKGLFPDLVALIFEGLPGYELRLSPFPWNRAQDMVSKGTAQGFLTYPSKNRQDYATFSKEALFVEDIGYLVFHPSNKRAAELRKVVSFEQLRDFLFLGSDASEWENDNIPSFVKKESVLSDFTRMRLLLVRQYGDFAIMGRENANYVMKDIGYTGPVEFKKVSFLPDTEVPFHIGISNKYKDSSQLLQLLEKQLQKPSVQKRIRELVASYSSKQ